MMDANDIIIRTWCREKKNVLRKSFLQNHLQICQRRVVKNGSKEAKNRRREC